MQQFHVAYYGHLASNQTLDFVQCTSSSVSLLRNAPCCNPEHSSVLLLGHHLEQYRTEYFTVGSVLQLWSCRFLWFVSPALTYDEAKLFLILQHWKYPRTPPPSPAPRVLPKRCSSHEEEIKAGSYLSRLGRGMEPEPDPSIFFFPLNNFSTRATFPVRAASSSSCSFPIPDTSLQRRGN